MVFEVDSHVVDPAEGEFLAREAETEVVTKPTVLGGPVRVDLDQVDGGSVEVEGHRDSSGTAFYRLRPVDLGPNRWLQLEMPLDIRALRGCDQLIPLLIAAAPSSATVFAMLRLDLPDGRYVDAGSMEVELRRTRKNYSFPISLDDLAADDVGRAESARLLFVIEARDVDLDYFGVRLFAVERMVGASDDAAVERVREVASTDSSAVRVRRMATSALRRPVTRMASLREFGDSVFVDADHANGAPWCHRTVNGVTFDFAPARACRWRSFEFRFSDVAASPTLSAMVVLEGRATGRTPWVSAAIRVRSYASDGTWEDSPTAGALDVSRKNGRHAAVVDIAPLLPDDRDVHTFGVMVFVPEGCRTLHVNEFETYLYDRSADHA